MNFISDLFKYENNLNVIGLTSELDAFYVYNYYKNYQKNVLVVTSSLYEANKMFQSLSFYSSDVYLFPMDDFFTSVALAISPELKIKRLETLAKINTGKPIIVVTNLMGYLRYLPDKNEKDNLKLNIKIGENISREIFLSKLEEFGYQRESLVVSTGEYAVRGYIIDIFVTSQEHPIRIEFFGNQVESIRYFDENTQLSLNKLEEFLIVPYNEVKTTNVNSLLDYMNDCCVFFDDYDLIDSSYKKLVEEVLNYKKENNLTDDLMFKLEDLKANKTIYLSNFDNLLKGSKYTYSSNEIDNFNGNFKLLQEFVNKYIQLNKYVVFSLSNSKQVDVLKEYFSMLNVVKNGNLHKDAVNIIFNEFNKGFIFENYVVITDKDIERVSVEKIKYKSTYKIGKRVSSFDQLNKGDYVVHTSHGIGVYNGVITLEHAGVKKDYIQINYLGNDKIYVPVEKISTIFKYSSKDGAIPHINKLNSTSWEKTKRQLQKKIHDMSLELIKLYAKRASIKGVPYRYYEEEDVFGNLFKYTLTKDQEKAIKEIKKDLESTIPMDRLLCGDVGFGKTEVAFRAMFKTVINNKQVLYLCPTTILSKQQYDSALERFKDYPIEIGLLNRFTTTKEKNILLAKLKNGTLDILFGTHRLLNDQVVVKDLGLLVIDEEQRFGVAHKEKIKQLKNDVNVLTLSATPIPRTLKMSLSGLRDLSIIDTPPVNRYPVSTYVLKENDLIIKEAIYKELARNGQIFVLYNQVSSIESKVNYLHRLVPEARIIFAHGQMSKRELENVMQDFIDYKYDILVCTTIIETGIDIPNANTLIVFDADKFGLSQLYQLRGRVGRSNKIAYAYLLYNFNKVLNDIAVKRLQAIKDFTELGSGYRIAMRDLSLRGAGDILGSEQAGFVDAVGIELYTKMVEDEIKKINGTYVEDEVGEKSLVNIETHISDSYVSDEDLKILIHKKINEIDSGEKLDEIKKELEDRFGKIDDSIMNYMYEEWFEKLAEKLSIDKVVQSDIFVEIEIKNKIANKLKFDKIFIKAYNICPRFQFRSFANNVYIRLNYQGLNKHFIYYFTMLLDLIYEEYKKIV